MSHRCQSTGQCCGINVVYWCAIGLFPYFGSQWVPETQNRERDPKTIKVIISQYKHTQLGQNSAIPPNRIYRYPFSTLYGVIHTIACFRISVPSGFQIHTKPAKNRRTSPNQSFCMYVRNQQRCHDGVT